MLKEAYCQQAIQHSLIAKDDALYVGALKGLAVTFYYRHWSTETLQTYQQALQHCNGVSPLLRSCIHAGIAQAYASCGEEQQALDFIDLAHQTFPQHPESDTHFLYADFDKYQLSFLARSSASSDRYVALSKDRRPPDFLRMQYP